ncbi:MAG TPA: hypothetical protein VMZ91_02900 [Candidatus Paceibacterota bacterium]|nr:hypothetical protein [Candidatus Paceibacterota bacterium]
MKNKKDTDVLTIIIIILLVLAVIVIVWKVVVYNIKPQSQFNITKDECVNETIYTYGCACENFSTKHSYIEQKCQQKEVEEIEIKHSVMKKYTNFLFWSWEIEPSLKELDNCNKICEKYEGSELTPGVCMEGECCSCNIPYKISKKDLNIKWLEENCECINCPCKATLNGKECVWKTQEDCNRNCQKYKCQFDENKYFVEIK